MRKIVLFIAMSLDGYVADKNKGVSWLTGHTDSQDMGTYPSFIKKIDTVILGYNTYHQIVTELSPDNWVYGGMKTYVITHRKEENTDEIEFTSEDVADLIARLKQQEGKDIWICGGANIINQLIKRNLIDTYQITVVPILLGDGLRLFEKNNNEKKLQLISTESYNGMTDLIYELRD